MAGFTIILDPDTAPLELVTGIDGFGFHVLTPLKKTKPQFETQWGGNIDTEGDLPAGSKAQNIEITPRLRITGGSEADFYQRQLELGGKLYKYGPGKEGGILRLVYPSGKYLDYAIRATTGGEELLDNRFVHNLRTEDEISFLCAPYGVGQEKLEGSFSGSGRLLECLIKKVAGTAPALARAEVLSPEADLMEVEWGLESRHYSDAATARAEFLPADLVTAGGSALTIATVEGKAGVSVIRQGTLTPNWTAMASTGLLTHEGVFEIVAWIHMPTTNTGEVAVAFEYGVGDLSRRTELERLYFPADHIREGKVVKVVLGQAWLRSQGRGDHRWEGRLLARSSVAGDDLDLLAVGFKPVGERNGRVAITPTLDQPAALLSSDPFDQAAGNLNGKVMAAASSLATRWPATVASVVGPGGGTAAWTSPENAKAADGAYAQATVTAAGVESKYTHALKGKKFVASLPAGAVPEGIEVAVRRHRTGDDIGSGFRIHLYKAGVKVATKVLVATWPTAPSVAILGGALDLWGTTWSQADLNAEGFEVAVEAFTGNGAGTITFLVDELDVLLHYTDAEGQKWVTSGDADDIKVETAGHTAERAAVSDANIDTGGRYAVAGTTVTTDLVVGLLARRSSITPAAGERARVAAMTRFVDENNWLYFCVDTNAPTSPAEERLRLFKRVAGTLKEVANELIPTVYGVYKQLLLQVDRRGRFYCWASLLESGVPRLVFAGQDSDLAAGGPLDDGKHGFYIAKTGAGALVQNVDSFVAWVPPLSAVVHQGLRLEISHDAYRQEVDGGAAWSELTPERDYLKLEPSVMENRQNRLVFLASPNDPETMGVGFPSELKVAVYVTPRYLGVPDSI